MIDDLPGAHERLEALRRHADRATALALFDALPAVAVEDLAGAWRGYEVRTGHPLDGLLERYGWWGKRFDSPEEAHPLVFEDARGRFGVDPDGIPLALLVRSSGLLHQRPLALVARRLRRLRRTMRPKARLRMVEHRGVVTAAMVYDALPVLDHFRRVDPDTLLAVMDARGVSEPFFFLLRRA
ncbi:DUF4334 domain-containing protein [Microlunatus spumicola]|uniref:DUF4334 domain-containing protein n=1 Tax=Microlunatus spumicola TaxID=81499 RepID=A0ABP6XP38_9ACTN